MAEDTLKAEQTCFDLPALKMQPGGLPAESEKAVPVNVFRPNDTPDEHRDLIRRHMLWLGTVRKEYPMPGTPYRIGVYIRYFNQTKYEDYLEYHKRQFRDTIAICPLWTLVDFYVDHGQSAPNMENAPEWCRLLNDCFEGRVNLIITQKISNVSRKVWDLTLMIRLLASLPEPVGIYFINEDVFSLASYYQRDMRETGFLPLAAAFLHGGEDGE